MLFRSGLIDGANGEGHWWFMDWVPHWTPPDHRGVPPGAEFGVNGTVNWQYALVLGLASELETFVGEPELAQRNRWRAAAAAKTAAETFWDEDRRLFADDPEKNHFSEHAQCMALLSGELDANTADFLADRLFSEPDLDRTTISFAHYLFETCAAFGRADVFLDRLDFWFGCLERGARTTVERDHPSRSDCHGWGAHPIYQFLATILGIRPACMGFETVRIEPRLGSLRHATGSLPHPQGDIDVALRVDENGRIRGTVGLPETLSGTFVAGGTTQPLRGGEQHVEAP